MIKFNNEWDILLRDEFKKPYYLKLRDFLVEEYTHRTIYPDMYDIFNALKYTTYSNIKVVIIGQDPYHEPGQAHGLSFSVKKGVEIPPSLMNIYKEIHDDLGCSVPNHGYLVKWAEQGVLLLNSVLTVRRGEANSHRNCGWEIFTNEVIRLVNKHQKPVVFLLWGGNAREKASLITNPVHLVLQAPHPSPLSSYRGFFGCKHFSAANDFLRRTGQKPIDWQID